MVHFRFFAAFFAHLPAARHLAGDGQVAQGLNAGFFVGRRIGGLLSCALICARVIAIHTST